MKWSAKAFTLAELLIALAIIGVLSVITIPAMISNYRAHVASARLKKFYSNMRTAIQISEIKNGRVANWDMNPNSKNTADDGDRFFMTYLAPYLKYSSKKKIIIGGPKGRYEYILPDGSSFQVFQGACIDFRYDVNGKDKPNEYGKDKFCFLLCNNERSNHWYFGNSRQYFGARGDGITTRAQAIKECSKKSWKYAEEGNVKCAKLLEMDGWEFKKDYPYKP